MRALLSTCFTPSALQAQEPAILSHIDHMVDQLRKRCMNGQKSSTTINVVEWVSFVVFDIIGDLGFGETFHCLDNSALHPWVAELFSYSKVGALVAALRHYTIIFNIFMRCLPAKSLEASRANYNWGVAKTNRRLDLEIQREDFVSRILQFNDNDDLRMSVPELENNMNLLIVAGSDTCATVLSGTLNYLVKTPKALKALVYEIRSSHRNPPEMTFENLQKLEYLVAVVEEGLRLCPPNPSGLQHIVPAGGDTVCGGWLPGGVSSFVN
jgi:cytochrome P450